MAHLHAFDRKWKALGADKGAPIELCSSQESGGGPRPSQSSLPDDVPVKPSLPDDVPVKREPNEVLTNSMFDGTQSVEETEQVGSHEMIEAALRETLKGALQEGAMTGDSSKYLKILTEAKKAGNFPLRKSALGKVWQAKKRGCCAQSKV